MWLSELGLKDLREYLSELEFLGLFGVYFFWVLSGLEFIGFWWKLVRDTLLKYPVLECCGAGQYIRRYMGARRRKSPVLLEIVCESESWFEGA